MSALTGKRVLNTRAIEQQPALDQLLLARGAIPISFPCIAIEALVSTVELDAELRHAAAGGYAWMLITSVNTSTVIERRLLELGLTLSVRVGAVGKATAASVGRWLGHAIEVIPDNQHASALAASLPIKTGDQVLIPASSKARTDLADAVRKRGGVPRTIEAYRTVTTELADGGSQIAERGFDAIAFASPSAVEGFAGHLRSAGMAPADLSDIAIACIGPTTHQAALVAGFSSAVQASTHSLDGLISALEQSISALVEREASSRI